MTELISHTNGTPTTQAKTARVPLVTALLMLVVLIAFTVLAVAAHNTPYFGFDLAITQGLQALDLPWFKQLLYLVGLPGYPPQVYIEVVVTLVVFWLVRLRWAAVTLIFADVLVGTVGTGVKMLVARMRPSPELVHVATPGLDGGGLSFPAGHVMGAVVILGFMLYLIWRAPHRHVWQWALFVVLAAVIVLVGPARIDSGEHWFSDVVGGYLFGVLGLWLTILFYEWGKTRFFTNDSRDARSETI